MFSGTYEKSLEDPRESLTKVPMREPERGTHEDSLKKARRPMRELKRETHKVS